MTHDRAPSAPCDNSPMAADWFYAMGSEPIGPYTAEQMKDLIRRGVINPETLVWREGQAGWLPVREAVGKPGGAATAAVPAAPESPPSAAAPAMATPAFAAPAPVKPPKKCDACRKRTPPSDLSREGDLWICGPCRMEAYRRQFGGGMPRYQVAQFYAAGFWIRLVARIIDGLILGLLQNLAFALFGIRNAALERLMAGEITNPVEAQAALYASLGSVMWLSLGTGLGYEMFFLGFFGATPGKLCLGLKVVSDEGEKIGLLRAFFRYFAMQLSGCACAIGYIMAAFTENKRALHDMICGTRVVHR